MLRQIAVILSALVFGSGILVASVVRVAAVKYDFSGSESVLAATEESKIKIDYQLPYPGILPDNPLWYFKVLRDKARLYLTNDPLARAELELLYADKRLAGSKILFEKNKTNLALSTLTKAEKYLEEAEIEAKKVDSVSFLNKLAKASLKHRQITEEILAISPEDVRPKVVQTQDYSKNVYKRSRDAILSSGTNVPKSPFNGD